MWAWKSAFGQYKQSEFGAICKLMLQNQPNPTIQTRVRRRIKWLLRDPMGQMGLLIGVFLAVFVQMRGVELEYGMQFVLHFFTIAVPVLLLIGGLTAPKMWSAVPPETLIWVLLAVIFPIGTLPLLLLITSPLFPQIPPRFKESAESACRLLVVLWTLLWVLYLPLLTLWVGYPNRLINRVESPQNNQVISTYQNDSDDRACKHDLLQRRAFPGVLYRLSDKAEQEKCEKPAKSNGW
jgi:hypothetical protein